MLWKKANWKVVQNELVGQLQFLYVFLCNTRDKLDTLMEAIHQMIENTIAKTIISVWPLPQAFKIWLKECTKVVKKTQQAYWAWKAF